jgi:hypothetical protein
LKFTNNLIAYFIVLNHMIHITMHHVVFLYVLWWKNTCLRYMLLDCPDYNMIQFSRHILLHLCYGLIILAGRSIVLTKSCISYFFTSHIWRLLPYYFFNLFYNCVILLYLIYVIGMQCRDWIRINWLWCIFLFPWGCLFLRQGIASYGKCKFLSMISYCFCLSSCFNFILLRV